MDLSINKMHTQPPINKLSIVPISIINYTLLFEKHLLKA